MISSLTMRGAIFTLVLGTIAGAAWGQDLQGDALRASAARVPSATVAPPQPVLTLEMRGDIYMARKQFRDAIDIFRQCPVSAVVENKIGIGYHQLYELKLAKKSYEKSIKLNPKYPEAVNNLGTVYYAQRSFRKSIKYYKRALKLEPSAASIWANLGSAYFAKHDFKRAAKAYDQRWRSIRWFSTATASTVRSFRNGRSKTGPNSTCTWRKLLRKGATT